MTEQGKMILRNLGAVRAERAIRAADDHFSARVTQIKCYQQARFEHTYSDLFMHPRYSAAAKFFLDEVYGPGDFTQRDSEFERIVPALVKLFPEDVVATVVALTAAHALSEDFDSEMARNISTAPLTRRAYVTAWQRTGRREGRRRQIDMVMDVGRALDVYTQRPLMRRTLTAMRLPARLAGLSSLHSFLTAGFETFYAMHGADEFLKKISSRERKEIERLFDAQI